LWLGTTRPQVPEIKGGGLTGDWAGGHHAVQFSTTNGYAMFPQKDSGPVIGRFAPSPTGPLHFGSLVAAVGSYCLARRAGGRWLVRIEDLDTPRVVPGAAEGILRTLESFGMFWDGEVLWQSRRLQRYEAALERLREKGLLFACGCSRREVLASAPHVGEEGPVYPGTCRQGLPEGGRPRALRIRVPAQRVCFVDGVFGSQEQCLVSAVGDFVLRRADGLFAYQLAVVVDDAESGVNQVVRGQDLLFSTPRQVFLHACLGYRVPDYVHLPLVLAPDGEKVSKRHGALAVEAGAEKGELLWQTLRFLGQPVPESLRAAPPAEVLAWGTAHFALERVPDRPAGIVG
jgi:glutamyl-Q tRNA(Asp) synthetase